jgi:site-specific DNA-methyltransferase (adenine-specific)
MNRVFATSCINLPNYLTGRQIDLVVTSPPYNIDLGRNKSKKRTRIRQYDNHQDDMPYDVYLNFLYQKFMVIRDHLKVGARVCVNIGDGKNGEYPTKYHLDDIMIRQLGFLSYTTIIWNKKQTSNRTAWGSWCLPSKPSFPRPFEYIAIYAYKTLKKDGDKNKATVTREEFTKFAYGIWEFSGIHDPEHPSPFPEELPYRCIQMLSYAGDLVCDPFCGTGATLIAAKKSRRYYLGFDISPIYVKIAQERLSEI